MDIKEVKDLIQEILQSDITEFELEHTGTKIKLSRNIGPAEPTTADMPAIKNPTQAPTADINVDKAPETIPSKEDDDKGEENLYFVTSPIVGTFYRAPSQGAKTYVEIGQTVEEGTILCIVEAMKIMNEIPSESAGEIVGIYVESSQPVEYGQKLFGIRPRS
jgi:acetyl-CoA carboxylase biotin carboxyl carrier protein